MVSVLEEIIGAETQLHAIDDSVIQSVRAQLASLPANHTKIFPGQSIADAIVSAKKVGSAPIGPATQSSYLEKLRAIFRVALRKKWMTFNPADQITPIKKDKLAASQKRLPFDDDQLQDIFTSDFYKSYAGGATPAHQKADRDWRFWMPLIMLFSGARPNEIAQLMTADLQRTKNGTLFLNLDEDKELKTENSLRRIPVHPELVAIGLPGFVAARRKSAGGKSVRLFPDLKPDRYGNFAATASKKFNRTILPSYTVVRERQSLYSLRHNVRDALRRVNAPAEALLGITGWAPAVATSCDYGEAADPDIQVEWVKKIAYKGLDLSFLHVAEAAS